MLQATSRQSTYAATINSNKLSAAATAEIRVRPPLSTLIIDWPIVAQPPIPPNTAATRFARPWPTHSLLVLPCHSLSASVEATDWRGTRVWVISSIFWSVISDSSSPMMAIMNASGKILPMSSPSIVGMVY